MKRLEFEKCTVGTYMQKHLIAVLLCIVEMDVVASVYVYPFRMEFPWISKLGSARSISSVKSL
jgi:hypothetical protein